jgi:hypothetical protein
VVEGARARLGGQPERRSLDIRHRCSTFVLMNAGQLYT